MIVISLKSTVDTVKKQYYLRSQTIERRFGDAKEQHSMRWTRYRGHDKVYMDTTGVMLICAEINFKKIAMKLVKGSIIVWKDTTIFKTI